MNEKEFIEIMSADDAGSKLSEAGCNAIKGLIIISKYLPLVGVEGAGHDIIYSCTSEKIAEAGITEEDAKELRDLNWMYDEGQLACFV